MWNSDVGFRVDSSGICGWVNISDFTFIHFGKFNENTELLQFNGQKNGAPLENSRFQMLETEPFSVSMSFCLFDRRYWRVNLANLAIYYILNFTTSYTTSSISFAHCSPVVINIHKKYNNS